MPSVLHNIKRIFMVSVYVTSLYATTVFMVEILMAGWLELEIKLCTIMDTLLSTGSSAISAKMIKVQNWIKVQNTTMQRHAKFNFLSIT